MYSSAQIQKLERDLSQSEKQVANLVKELDIEYMANDRLRKRVWKMEAEMLYQVTEEQEEKSKLK